MSEFLVRWKNGPNREVVTYALLNSPATFCNHSVEPNAALVRDVDRHICELVAIHEIAAGDEITISYYNPDESYKNSV